jgi:hypothetical protein
VHAVLIRLPFQDQVTNHEEPLFDILVIILAQILGSTYIGIKMPLLGAIYLKFS